jgi:YD repeat-containing protein
MTFRVFLILLFFIAPILQAKVFTYDALGRLRTVTDDNNVTVTYEYDAVGNRKTLSTTHSPTPPTIYISWSTPVISPFGHSASLTWSTENATQCTGTIIPYNKVTSGINAIIPYPYNKAISGINGTVRITTIFSATAKLRCTNENSSIIRTASLVINGACLPNTICLPPGDPEF